MEEPGGEAPKKTSLNDIPMSYYFFNSALRIPNLSEPEGSPSGAEVPLGWSLSRRPHSIIYHVGGKILSIL
jgi:hypothetical protein